MTRGRDGPGKGLAEDRCSAVGAANRAKPLSAQRYAEVMGRRFEDERERARKSGPWYWHEDKTRRRQTNRRVRHETRARIRRGDHDALPKPPRTEGWLTW
jgi:hypothetical protein